MDTKWKSKTRYIYVTILNWQIRIPHATTILGIYCVQNIKNLFFVQIKINESWPNKFHVLVGIYAVTF